VVLFDPQVADKLVITHGVTPNEVEQAVLAVQLRRQTLRTTTSLVTGGRASLPGRHEIDAYLSYSKNGQIAHLAVAGSAATPGM
jgi:hypothetical protein